MRQGKIKEQYERIPAASVELRNCTAAKGRSLVQALPRGGREGEWTGGYVTFVWRERACSRSRSVAWRNHSANARMNNIQRKRDDNKNKICTFEGGLGRGAGRKIVQNAIFHGKRHDNKILKLKILLSRNFVVMAQAPKHSCLKV